MLACSPDPAQGKLRGAVLAFLFLSVLAFGFIGTGLVLGTEPRLVIERSTPGSFRVTGSNHFAGYQFFTKTIEGVSSVTVGSAARDRLGDSQRERQRRQSQKHLDMFGVDGRRLGWDREDDKRQIEDFMRGNEPRLALADPPPTWRMTLAWMSAAFGALAFIGAIQSSFFPKANAPRLP